MTRPNIMIVIAVLLLAPSLTSAQSAMPDGVRMIENGKEVRSGPGQPNRADLYTFVTLPGDQQRVLLRSSSERAFELQIRDPGGNVVAQSWGKREVEIETIPAWGDIYTIAVLRAEPTANYTLSRTATPGSLPQFLLAHMAGYRRLSGLKTTRCWSNPGRTIKIDFGDYVLERSVNGEQIRNRRIRSGQPTVFWTQTAQIVGDQIEVVDLEDGDGHKTTLSLDPGRLRYSSDYEPVGATC